MSKTEEIQGYLRKKIDEGQTEIPLRGSRAKWIKNPNYENNWHLEKKVFELGENQFKDKTDIRIYGWVEEVELGYRKGQIEATIAAPYDETNDSDCEVLGYYNSVDEAMEKVLKNNHPEYSVVWI